jgi:multimeric flavodoxin WrbA
MRAIESLEISGLEVRIKAPLDAEPDDVDWCDGILMGATENFGYMAGRIKDFFERIYYPCLESAQGLPVGLYIRAREDGTGASGSIERITTGLRWKYVDDPLILRGNYEPEFKDQVAELAMTMAAGLDAGVF